MADAAGSNGEGPQIRALTARKEPHTNKPDDRTVRLPLENAEPVGHSPSSIPQNAELTAEQAADLLNVSLSFLVGLLEAGDIGYHEVGGDRRITASSLLEYKRRDDERRRRAAEGLTELGQEMGLL
ncbi:helix-turn-helix domain-containing protein [Streptomyces sp. TRM 70361]|uniref:helix-turn-helix domain-containing protein n=1 Tax=Streptomyces sp. TRM 70361 TaxID=3116553 RepID=UPI002E7BA095|nr:helix-turn-helix domain-containing protein [Streptomyces sp. TRM 70361]MEE1940517.1 helix-turn-helix domain-containing protein [Streptomyces sp. TRM 70361]